MKPSERIKKITLEITQPRIRNGCDLCKLEKSTWQFIGFGGHQIWLCEDCIEKLLDKKTT